MAKSKINYCTLRNKITVNIINTLKQKKNRKKKKKGKSKKEKRRKDEQIKLTKS